MGVGIRVPGWRHKSGYRLSYDGGHIRYLHDELGLEAYVQAMDDPDMAPPHLQYRPSIFDEDGQMLEYPPVCETPEAALEQLESWMEAYGARAVRGD